MPSRHSVSGTTISPGLQGGSFGRWISCCRKLSNFGSGWTSQPGRRFQVQLTSNQTSLLPDKLAGDATLTSEPATTGPHRIHQVCVPMKSPRVCPPAKRVYFCNQSHTRFNVRNAANSRHTNARYDLPPASLTGRSISLAASNLQLQPTSPRLACPTGAKA